MFAVPQEIKIITVTKLNRFAKQVLESEIGQVWVSGEISNFTRAASGHWYFTLKDDKAQVRTCMFKGANQKLSFMPKHGDKVVVRANLSLYEARGDYQLIAVHMEPEGLGQLKQAFEALKLSLQAEGLFKQEAKQALPANIQKIGIVTSPTGAAVHDILHVLQRRNPAIEVIIYPSMVQGDGAASSIAKQIEVANTRAEVDVLVVGRGGGSLEDLWSFNEEIVARAIFASTLPIVSAVGHEVDVTIADFVADVRAATPSAAAELLSEDKQALENNINVRKRALMRALTQQLSMKQHSSERSLARLNVQHPQKRIDQYNQSIDYLYARLVQQHPHKKIQQQKESLLYLEQRLLAKHPSATIKMHQSNTQQQTKRLHQSIEQKLSSAKQSQQKLSKSMQYLSPNERIQSALVKLADTKIDLQQALTQQLSNKQSRFANLTSLLNTVSPLATLSRGYSITLKHDSVVKSIADVKPEDTLVHKLVDGEITTRVVSSTKSKI